MEAASQPPIVISCASGDIRLLSGVAVSLRDRDNIVELVTGAERNDLALMAAVEKTQRRGLYVLCRSPELGRDNIERLRSALRRCGVPFARTLTVSLEGVAAAPRALEERVLAALRRLTAHAAEGTSATESQGLPISTDRLETSRPYGVDGTRAHESSSDFTPAVPDDTEWADSFAETHSSLRHSAAEGALSVQRSSLDSDSHDSSDHESDGRVERRQDKADTERRPRVSAALPSLPAAMSKSPRPEASLANNSLANNSLADAEPPQALVTSVETEAASVVRPPTPAIEAAPPLGLSGTTEISPRSILPPPIQATTPTVPSAPAHVAPHTTRSPSGSSTSFHINTLLSAKWAPWAVGGAAVVTLGVLVALLIPPGSNTTPSTPSPSVAAVLEASVAPDAAMEPQTAAVDDPGTPTEALPVLDAAEPTPSPTLSAEANPPAQDDAMQAVAATPSPATEATRSTIEPAAPAEPAANAQPPSDSGSPVAGQPIEPPLGAPPPPASPVADPPAESWGRPEDAPAVLAALETRQIRAVDTLLVSPMAEGSLDYPQAEAFCSTLDVAGLTGWRLPTIGQLNSLAWAKLLGTVAYWSHTEGDAFLETRLVLRAQDLAIMAAPMTDRWVNVVCIRDRS